MKTRTVTLSTGESFTVPQGIQRLDSRSTRGWQVRYQGTKYFPDGEVGPAKAFEAATRNLLRRIATMPAPVTLRRTSSPNKASGLPVGISGPILVAKAGTESLSAVLSVAVPRFGKSNLTKKVHIGTPIFPSWAHAVAHCGSLGMGLLPEYRGRGIGRQLLQACIAKARAKGITRIELEVRADNTRAIGLYKALGFDVEAVKRQAMRFDGVYYDALQMSLLQGAA